MNFPLGLTDEKIDLYEEIFAARDGERLLREWQQEFTAGEPTGHQLTIQHFVKSIVDGQLDFTAACLKILPDRFFDLRQPLAVHGANFHEALYAKLRAFAGEPAMAARYHPVVELMAQRGWDMTYGVKAGDPGAPMLYEIVGIKGAAPLVRRLLPHIGGAQALRSFSDSFCNGLTNSTLLHRAVDTQDVEMVRFLVVEAGVDANTVDSMGRTALMANLWILSNSTGFATTAKLERASELVRELVALGLNVDRKDNSNDTAVIHAVQADNVGALRLLMELGADLKILDDEKRTLLQVAEEAGSSETTRILRSLELQELLGGVMSPDDEESAPSARSRGFTL